MRKNATGVISILHVFILLFFSFSFSLPVFFLTLTLTLPLLLFISLSLSFSHCIKYRPSLSLQFPLFSTLSPSLTPLPPPLLLSLFLPSPFSSMDVRLLRAV